MGLANQSQIFITATKKVRVVVLQAPPINRALLNSLRQWNLAENESKVNKSFSCKIDSSPVSILRVKTGVSQLRYPVSACIIIIALLTVLWCQVPELEKSLFGCVIPNEIYYKKKLGSYLLELRRIYLR